MDRQQQMDWLLAVHLDNDPGHREVLEQYLLPDPQLQQLHGQFAENTITNYLLPFSIAPNFIINGKPHSIPMVIEESSVVAAASKAAKFWSLRGGFQTEVVDTIKVGQVHFTYTGTGQQLKDFFAFAKAQLQATLAPLSASMEKRGGGLIDIELRDKTADLDHYYQLHCSFRTADAMGANYINTCLEAVASRLRELAAEHLKGDLEVVMSILSNYVPQCIVRASVWCPVSDLGTVNGLTGEHFARKFVQALEIARIEPYRAVTHNKGIMNGVDAVVLATGNDFRAVAAGVHAYASRDGQYRSLSTASVKDGIFNFSIELPLALGTVGGLTKLHPLVRTSLAILDQPTASQLMEIVAVAGLAQNFGAIHSLVTTGIQKGHMKMHLRNLITQLEASPSEMQELLARFKDRDVSATAVREELELLRA